RGGRAAQQQAGEGEPSTRRHKASRRTCTRAGLILAIGLGKDKAHHRARMAYYLADRKTLDGLTRADPVEMLGEPDVEKPGDEGTRWFLGRISKGPFDETLRWFFLGGVRANPVSWLSGFRPRGGSDCCGVTPRKDRFACQMSWIPSLPQVGMPGVRC